MLAYKTINIPAFMTRQAAHLKVIVQLAYSYRVIFYIVLQQNSFQL